MINYLIIVIAVITSGSAYAQAPRMGFSKAQVEEMVKHNSKIAANTMLNQLEDVITLKKQAGEVRVPCGIQSSRLPYL